MRQELSCAVPTRHKSSRIKRERVGNERLCRTARLCHRLCPPYKLNRSRMHPTSATQEVANLGKPELAWVGARESRRVATATRVILRPEHAHQDKKHPRRPRACAADHPPRRCYPGRAAAEGAD